MAHFPRSFFTLIKTINRSLNHIKDVPGVMRKRCKENELLQVIYGDAFILKDQRRWVL